MKDLAIGGIVMLENVSGEPDTIVEAMVVNKVDLIGPSVGWMAVPR